MNNGKTLSLPVLPPSPLAVYRDCRPLNVLQDRFELVLAVRHATPINLLFDNTSYYKS